VAPPFKDASYYQTAERAFDDWLTAQGFTRIPPGRRSGGVFSSGQTEVWYQGSAAGTKSPLSLIIVKEADTGKLSGYVVWHFEGPSDQLKSDEAKAVLFARSMGAWWGEYDALKR
jgi:hypothetical protein